MCACAASVFRGIIALPKLSVLPTMGCQVRFVECMMIMFGFRLSDKLMNVCTADPSVSYCFLCMCALMVILFFRQLFGGKMDWPLPLYI